jgi:hypothetical protein
MKHSVVAICATSAFVLTALSGCRSDGTRTQSFTRQVPASTAAIVESAVKTFSDYGISVTVADEPGGKVQTAPADLKGRLASGSPDDRVTCEPGPAASDATSSPLMISFQVTVRPVSGGSVVLLEARRESGGNGCIVKSTFVAQLLDGVVQGARRP